MPADDVQVAPDIIAEHAGQAQKCEHREIYEHGLAAEEGISILPGYFTDKLYNADNLSFAPMVGDGEYEEIIAAWRRDSVNPILEQFPEFLRAACPLSE